MHTVELLLDSALDDAVRALWHRLHEAGLRSLATHTHATNRPHITLATTAELPPSLPLTLPVPVRLGPPRILGRALALTADSPELRALQADVWQSIAGLNPLHAPDRWIPHVSLALTMPAGQHEQALQLLRDNPILYGESVAARTYDTTTRLATDLTPRP
ncbi:2'-5' RNA ligase family protein [Actinoplanes sp. NPDC023714]|uniref:2'-5' RNA ligase family protein n=1 Tax=Actinoplanes sp. NPDC023714 TaxID=3154322 RepID=UPI0034102CD0